MITEKALAIRKQTFAINPIAAQAYYFKVLTNKTATICRQHRTFVHIQPNPNERLKIVKTLFLLRIFRRFTKTK